MDESQLIPEAHRTQAPIEAESTELNDVILVNPGGRTIAVTGEHAQKLLQENGFRVATDAEIAAYDETVKNSAPEVLAAKEQQRLQVRAAVVAPMIAAATVQEAPQAAADEKMTNDTSSATEAPQAAADDAEGQSESTDTPKPRSRS